MQVDRFEIVKGSPQQIQGPFIRISNIGCGAGECNCSPDRYISVSDGEIGIGFDLTEEEFEVIRQAFLFPDKVWVSLEGAGEAEEEEEEEDDDEG